MHGIAVRLPQRLALSLVLVVTLLGPTLGAQSAPSRVVLPSPEALDTHRTTELVVLTSSMLPAIAMLATAWYLPC
jgi:hypothetical protein